jgi:hypothetical protein
MNDLAPGPCPYCDQWLTTNDWMAGYCWNCNRDPHPTPEGEDSDVE